MTTFSLMPHWLKKDEEDELPPPPPLTAVDSPFDDIGAPTGDRPPEYTQADHDREIFGRAAVVFEQIQRDRTEMQRREEQLRIDLTEATLAHEGDRKKIDYLELENAELRNTITTLQTDLNECRTFLSKIKEVLDRFGIQAPPKKPRNGNGNKKKQLPPVVLPPVEPAV
jgi:hypothetical protein